MKIAVCTPSRSGRVHHDYMSSYVETWVALNSRGDSVLHLLVPGCSLLTRARNRLVAEALSRGCDFVFFIDDDIGWEPADFLKLVDYGVDVVAGAPARRNRRWNDAPLAVVRLAPKFGTQAITQVRFPDGRRLWRAEGAATAFMCIKSSVFKEIEPLTEEFWSDDNPGNVQTRTWFWIDLCELPEVPDRLHDQGEDYNFCWKWRGAGGDVFVDPDVRLRHYDGNVCFDACPADQEVKQEKAANG